MRAEEVAVTVFVEEKKSIDGKYVSCDFLLDGHLSPLAALSTSIKSRSPVAETALAGAPTLFDSKAEYVTSHSTAYIEATGVISGMAGPPRPPPPLSWRKAPPAPPAPPPPLPPLPPPPPRRRPLP